MKKTFLKATFVVAAAALTTTGSLVAYDRYQQSQFAAANPLFAENLESLADPSSSGSSNEPHFGPALKVTHKEATLSDSIMWKDARNSLSSSEYDSFCKHKKVDLCVDYDDVPEDYREYMHFGTKKPYWTGERHEWELNGYFYDCQDIGYTALSDNNKPGEGL